MPDNKFKDFLNELKNRCKSDYEYLKLLENVKTEMIENKNDKYYLKEY